MGTGRDDAKVPTSHAAGVDKVMRAVHRELRRAAYIEGEFPKGWIWTHALPPPDQPGQREMVVDGRAAVVLCAGAAVLETYQMLSGPRVRYWRLLRKLCDAKRDLQAFMEVNVHELTADLHNLAVVQAAGIGFGANPANSPTIDFDDANALLGDLHQVTSDVELHANVIAASLPRAIVAGFYEPKGSGGPGQFAVLLAESGMENAEVAEVFGKIENEHGFSFRAAFLDHRARVVDAVKHSLTRKRARLAEMTRDSCGTRTAAVDVPPQDCSCVLTSVRHESGATFTSLARGRRSVPRDGGVGPALDSNGPTAESTTRA